MTTQPENAWPVSDAPEDAEAWLGRLEHFWRLQHIEGSIALRERDDEPMSDTLEVWLFAYGLMASIMRTTRAQIIMVREGYIVESRAMFRSILDQALALTELERSRVHAVHAYGMELAYSLKRLRESAKEGFVLGDVNLHYIERFVKLSESIPDSPELNRARHAIKTSTIRTSGKMEAMIYQAWLEATPLSKPSMRLADVYSGTVPENGGYKVVLAPDGKRGQAVDPRLVLGLFLPQLLRTYALIVQDYDLAKRVDALE